MTIEESLTLFGLVLTFTAFVAGLFQYNQAQRWKAVEFVSGEVKEFLSNRDVKNVMLMLDYNARPITFLVQKDDREELKVVIISDEIIQRALMPHHLREGAPLKLEEALVRDTFDTFFDFLARFDHYIEATKLVRYDDFHPYLAYYLEILSDNQSGRKPQGFVEVIDTYLRVYQYQPVQDLLRKYQLRSRKKQRKSF